MYKGGTAVSAFCLVNPRQRAQAIQNQHPPGHHPLDACYFSVVDEPQEIGLIYRYIGKKIGNYLGKLTLKIGNYLRKPA